jgi:hypothetical protein
MLVACTIDTGELQPDGDSNEWPEKRHDCIYRRDSQDRCGHAAHWSLMVSAIQLVIPLGD